MMKPRGPGSEPRGPGSQQRTQEPGANDEATGARELATGAREPGPLAFSQTASCCGCSLNKEVWRESVSDGGWTRPRCGGEGAVHDFRGTNGAAAGDRKGLYRISAALHR